jgi:hypothetical protein
MSSVTYKYVNGKYVISKDGVNFAVTDDMIDVLYQIKRQSANNKTDKVGDKMIANNYGQ